MNMADLDPDKLEEVLDRSGVGERARKKVREANAAGSSAKDAKSQDDKPTPRSRGNGVAGVDKRPFGDL